MFVRISAKYLPIIYPFMGKDDVRYYLNGILVETHPNGGILLVATDGHRLVTVHDAEGETSEEGGVTLPLPNAARNAVPSPRSHKIKPAWACYDGEAVHLVGKNVTTKEQAQAIGINHFLTLYAPPLNPMPGGQIFPDWRKVIKRPDGELPATMKLPYLEDLVPAVRGLRGSQPIQLWPSKEGINAVRVPGLPEAAFFIMPYQKDDMSPIPDWLGDTMGGSGGGE